MVLLDTGTPGSSREIYDEDAVYNREVASSSLTIGEIKYVSEINALILKSLLFLVHMSDFS